VVVCIYAVGTTAAGALETTAGGVSFSATGYIEDRQGFEVQNTPDDRNFQELWLRLRATYGEHIGFDSTFATRNGGPTTRSNHAGFYRWDAVFQSVSPAVEFEEAMLRLRFDQIDLRIGKQKIAWGRLDRTQPTDLLNTEKFDDPFLRDEEHNKIGVPAVNGSYYPSAGWLPAEARLNLVWIPWYHPYRFPVPGERWFPPAAIPPPVFPVNVYDPDDPDPTPPVTGPDGQPLRPTLVPLDFHTPNVAPPSFNPNNSGYALRASAYSAGLDYSLMYYHGFDMQPAFSLSATVFPGETCQTFTAITELRPSFHNIDAWGGDAAYTWGLVTLRGEGAFIHGRPLSRDLRTLIEKPTSLHPQIQTALNAIWSGASSAEVALPPSFVVRDVFEWGIGADTTLDGYFLLLQLNQTDVFDNDTDLIIEDVETRLLGTVRKSFLQDDLQLQLQGIYGVSSDYTLLLPRLTYRIWRGLEGQIGYLFIAGRQSSVGGQYKRNDEAFIRLRYLF
jgi:hypothetical protein